MFFSPTVLSDEYVSNFALSSQMFPLFQECLGLIRRLCVEEAVGTELTNKLAENLEESRSDNKVSVSDIKHIMPGLPAEA